MSGRCSNCRGKDFRAVERAITAPVAIEPVDGRCPAQQNPHRGPPARPRRARTLPRRARSAARSRSSSVPRLRARPAFRSAARAADVAGADLAAANQMREGPPGRLLAGRGSGQQVSTRPASGVPPGESISFSQAGFEQAFSRMVTGWYTVAPISASQKP